ncbi:MAG: hypothetical protein EA405_09180 [Rhodospirillales bacterium]|nr:MAG: hypothetical protein EA405_09180 [Rhodospirillales bacterium]
MLAVQVADDTVVIDAALPLGDRANGGIRDARVAAGTLMVERALTPFALVDLLHRSLTGEDGSAGAAFGLRAYDDLPACAVCDVGQATYRVDADFRETLVSVNLDTEALQAHLEPRANDAALACLAAFAEPAFAAGPIPAEALPAAAQAYRARCIARP